MGGGLVVADVVVGRGRGCARVGGGERVVARAQVVRAGLGLPRAREDALLIASHSGYTYITLEYITALGLELERSLVPN